MRTAVSLVLVLLLAASATAEDRLISPYRQQALSELRGLNATEIAELRAGHGMGLARAAELNGYPGPRHVLDAVHAGELQALPEQAQRVQEIFDGMNRDAQRVGAQILEEEQRLEATFSSATITDADLQSRVMRITGLRGELRTIHLRAHLATRAALSDAQVARYNELRGYTTPRNDTHGQPHAR